MVGKILKCVASKYQQNVFPLIKVQDRVLSPKTVVLKGALLTT